ncbi:sialate O-acetylesterase [Thalassoglobus sp. JC818]|uniref:sialate O-acetylesterase n=1 Tax=Thalassoglobus sp. JC818 TaxID=3232136 RepID=UPI003459C455
MKPIKWMFSVAVLIGCMAPVSVDAEVKLPSIIGDNMVLQRGQKVPIWGWDEPGQEVTVTVQGKSKTGTANENGRWEVIFEDLKTGPSYEVQIAGSSELTLKNVAVGEVWLCSGQSNMEWTVNNSKNAEEERAAANYPLIRHIKIPHTPMKTPQDNVPSNGWEVTTPETVGNYTAVGYFFALNLQAQLDVPIGLIGSNWGGTRIEPWTPPVGFKEVPALKSIADKLEEYPEVGPDGKVNHQSPLALYNGMISPLVPYAIRGAIWYQGESNRHDGMLYFEKMKALISGWRHLWSNPELPFYYVQLAPYRYKGEDVILPKVWEAQTEALTIPNTGMAVTVDIGNLDDIHPRNKQDVGYRLALWALAKTYGHDDLVYSGPLFKSMNVKGDKIVLRFDHVGDGLVSRNGEPLSHFEIAGEDGEYKPAKAEIKGKTVVVSSDDVPMPKSVRLGWHQEAEPNLSNKNGLPASPFRAGE